MMVFRRSDLQEAFFVPGTHAFRVYGYGTSDPLDEVLAAGYFQHGGGLLRPGDLIYVSSCPAPAQGGAAPRGPRMALVMARPDERDPAHAAGSVRLVQDFGRASDPAGCRHPARRPTLPRRRRRPNAAAAARPAARTEYRPRAQHRPGAPTHLSERA